MGKYSDKNAQEVLARVNERIFILEERKANWDNMSYCERKYYTPLYFEMREVCKELSIFDWWIDKLSLTRLYQMRQFLETAIELGFTGYVCFKVGVSGCANGMWAHTMETETGYSPEGCDFLYRSFTTDYTYWDILYKEDVKLTELAGLKFDGFKTARQLKKFLKEPVNGKTA